MIDDGRCPKCGSEDRIPDVLVHGGFHARSIMVEIVEKAKSWFYKGKDTHQGVLTATICGRCGLTELYVKNPEELLEAYRQKQSPT
jgi:predicted nucleic-acid-binding Zn-ribbon protein